MEKSKSKKWFTPDFGLEAIINKGNVACLPIPSNSEIKRPKKELIFKGVVPHLNLIEQIHPKEVSDLAVHNKKVAEVENWLIENVQLTNVPALLLTGPTGAGKTATVHALCKAMKIDVIEWINPVEGEYDEEMRGPGQVESLREFLVETSRYPSLIYKNPYKITLVEDYPNAIIHSPSKFEEILELLFLKGKSPIVFICTETKDSNLNLSLQLFPQTLRDKFKISTISFNSVSVTLLKAALKRANNIIQEHNSMYQIPSEETVESIINSAMGDIRSAINYYNFACLKGSANLPSKLQIAVGTKRKRNQKNKGTLLSMTRDESIGLLHGVGRALYPKRIQSTWKFENPPESVIEQFSTMPILFIAFLQENYLRYFGNLLNVRDAADLLSVSELFTSQWIEKEIMVHYGLWIAVLGLMVKNENVVSKWNPVQGPKHYKQKPNVPDFTKIDPIDAAYENIIKQTGTTSRFNLK